MDPKGHEFIRSSEERHLVRSDRDNTFDPIGPLRKRLPSGFSGKIVAKLTFHGFIERLQRRLELAA